MKAFTLLGLASFLAMLTAAPLSGDDKEKCHDSFADFTKSQIQREARNLPLKLSEGTTYRWTLEARPYSSGHFSSPEMPGSNVSDKMACKHEIEAKATKVSGDESTITLTFDASKCEMCKEQCLKQGRPAPGKLIYDLRTNLKGEVLSFKKDESVSTGQGNEFENMLKTQARQLLGFDLHDGNLEPGKSYDVVWMHPDAWKMGSESKEVAQASRLFFELRYDGETSLDNEKDVRFTIVPATGSFSSPGLTESTGGIVTGEVAPGHGHESGYVAYRLDDGLLERFGFILPSSIVKEMHKTDVKGQEQGGMPGDMLITIWRTR